MSLSLTGPGSDGLQAEARRPETHLPSLGYLQLRLPSCFTGRARRSHQAVLASFPAILGFQHVCPYWPQRSDLPAERAISFGSCCVIELVRKLIVGSDVHAGPGLCN